MTTTTYDDGDRVATISDPLTPPRKTHFVYCTTATNCAANQVKTEYRAWVSGTACSQAPPSLQECYRRVTYFPDGEQQTIKDANGNTTTYGYDGFVRLTKTTFPDTTFEQLALDENANVTQRTNRAGQNLTYQVNALNWVTQKVSPSPADTTSWTYLLDGQIDLLNDTLGNALNYKFDTAARVTSLATKVPGLANRNVSYVLDDNGNRTKLTWPVTDGSYFAGYCYDNLNRMIAVMGNSTDSGCATNLLATYQYDTLSRRQQVTYGNGASMAYTYTDAGDLLTLNHDMTGTSNDPHYTFTYTNAHELFTEANSDADYVWQPTAIGSTSYTPNALNQYTAIGTQTSNGTSCQGATQGLSYDCNGNLTFDGNLTYGYDAENRLMTACKPSPCTSPTVNAAYQYDPLGRRTHKSGTGVTGTFYLSDGTDEIAEYDGTSGALTTRYIPGPAIDEPIAMVDGATGTKTYFHTNHQGSVIAMSGTGAALTEGPYTYDPFGNCFAGSSPCTTGEPYRFTGRRFDPETGLLYYRARYYDSNKGRFLQADPIGYTADLNLYTYVGNDPTNATDPTGRSCTGDPGNRTCQIDKIVDAKGNTIDPSSLSREQSGAIKTFNARYTREVNRLDKANKTTKLSLPTKADQNKNVSVDVSSSQLAGALAGRTVAACPSCEGNPHTEKGVTTLSSAVYEGRAAPAQGGGIPSRSGATAVFRHEGLHGSPMEEQLLRAAGATVDDLDSHRISGAPPGYAAGSHQAPYDAAAIDLGP